MTFIIVMGIMCALIFSYITLSPFIIEFLTKRIEIAKKNSHQHMEAYRNLLKTTVDLMEKAEVTLYTERLAFYEKILNDEEELFLQLNKPDVDKTLLSPLRKFHKLVKHLNNLMMIPLHLPMQKLHDIQIEAKNMMTIVNDQKKLCDSSRSLLSETEKMIAAVREAIKIKTKTILSDRDDKLIKCFEKVCEKFYLETINLEKTLNFSDLQSRVFYWEINDNLRDFQNQFRPYLEYFSQE